MIVGLTGPAMSGKNEIGGHLERVHGFEQAAFADPIRAMLIAGLDLQPHYFSQQYKEQVIDSLHCSPRRLMQLLGTEWGRNMVCDSIWTDLMARRLRVALHAGRHVVVTDVRFKSEAGLICRLGGRIVRVLRPSGATTAHSAHQSEREQSQIICDNEIINNGTLEQLYEQVDAAISAVSVMR